MPRPRTHTLFYRQRLPLKIFSTSHASQHEYINGQEVKNIELEKTRNNQWVQVKGHINNTPIFYQNFPPSFLMRDGMTELKSRRKRGKKRAKTEKKPKPDTSSNKRK